MRITTSSPKLLPRKISVLMLIVLLVSSMFYMVACSTTTEPVEEDTSPVQENTEQESLTSQYTDHDVDMSPEPFSETDKTISLEGYGAKGALTDQDMSIADMLMYAVQDEYLAHGEYAAILAEFGNQNPYANIIRSEETHISYLKDIYTAYGMTFPDDTSAEHLVIPINLLEAAKTGVQAEIDNIAMYEKFLTYELPEDVYEVFSALKSGSESHLLSFEKQVDKLSQ